MLYLYTPEHSEQWLPMLQQALPELEVAAWPQPVDKEQVHYIAAWNAPEGFFAGFTQLKAVFSLGAGVDKLLRRGDLAEQVPIIRLTDAGMAQQMAEYVLYGVLHYQRQFDLYRQQQTQRLWQPLAPKLAQEVRVSVLGLGAIGAAVAKTLAGLGYMVSGWSRSPKEVPGVACSHGAAGLDALLANTDVLVSVLPSTPETRGLIDREFLMRLPRGAGLINVARGDQLDQDALLELLDAGQVRFAMLDVFASEPLAAENPLWARPDVIVTPHIAAITLIGPAVQQIADNLRALQGGRMPQGLVDRGRAY
jgi:glyoxylate/hydroxypyruvate reductase A